jgi:hypothetical protein
MDASASYLVYFAVVIEGRGGQYIVMIYVRDYRRDMNW